MNLSGSFIGGLRGTAECLIIGRAPSVGCYKECRVKGVIKSTLLCTLYWDTI